MQCCVLYRPMSACAISKVNGRDKRWCHCYNPLRWRHNGRDIVPNHQPHDCLLNRLFRRRSKKTSKLRVTGLCVGNSPGTGEFPAQMASNAENVSIWWRHHAMSQFQCWFSPSLLVKGAHEKAHLSDCTTTCKQNPHYHYILQFIAST